MNKHQAIVLWLGVIGFALVWAFPPWVSGGQGIHNSIIAGSGDIDFKKMLYQMLPVFVVTPTLWFAFKTPSGTPREETSTTAELRRTNTILIVILVLVCGAVAVHYFTKKPPQPETSNALGSLY